jgi:TPR repeat protein
MPQSSGEQLLARAECAYAQGDYELARHLFEEAEMLGSTEALYYLGVIFKDGDGVPADAATSSTYLQRFIRIVRDNAARGDAASQLRLGKLLQYGDQLLRDEQEALKWIQAAAENGHPPAQFHLSCLYAYGWCSLKANSTLRELWLRRAAEGGYPEAMYQTGVNFADRYLADRDAGARRLAVAWFERAKDSGYKEAETALRQVLEA